MTRRDTGAAIHGRILRRPVSEEGLQSMTESCRIEERAIRLQVVFVEVVDCAGDVSGHRIERLYLTTITFGSASINEQVSRIHAQAFNIVQGQAHLKARRTLKRRGWRLFIAGAH